MRVNKITEIGVLPRYLVFIEHALSPFLSSPSFGIRSGKACCTKNPFSLGVVVEGSVDGSLFDEQKFWNETCGVVRRQRAVYNIHIRFEHPGVEVK